MKQEGRSSWLKQAQIGAQLDIAKMKGFSETGKSSKRIPYQDGGPFWLMTAPAWTMTGIQSLCLFFTATHKTGTPSLLVQFGSAPCRIQKWLVNEKLGYSRCTKRLCVKKKKKWCSQSASASELFFFFFSFQDVEAHGSSQLPYLKKTKYPMCMILYVHIEEWQTNCFGQKWWFS